MICDNLSVSDTGRLQMADRPVTDLIRQYGSPLYLMDEERIRYNVRQYVSALKETFGESALVLYASKACSFKEMYRIMKEENAGVDVVSAGEIYTAVSAGFPMDKVYFHGNNKTDDEIAFALDHGVGYFVVDSREELRVINELAGKRGVSQKILLRITPGIDTHTYEAVATGQVDSKFGNAIETGLAEEITKEALSLQSVRLSGFHCHVGSQVFDSDTFIRAADILLTYIADIREKYGYEAEQLDLGGGYGVRYLESDPTLDIKANIAEVGQKVFDKCRELSLKVPAIRMEPGRSIVADAGMTLYTVGSVKRIPGYKTYVSVDGGMSDNPRYALYEAPYTVVCADKMKEDATLLTSVVGKCCESGDVLQEKVMLPDSVCRGDIVAVLTTGAYNYSMASHYNRIPKLPVVMLGKTGERVVVARETVEDVARFDR